MGASYENVNSANTDKFMTGWGANGSQNFYDYTRSAMAASGVMDPASIFTQFEAGAGGLMSLGLDATNPYVSAIDAYTNSIMGDTTRAALAPYSGDNALYSSGAVEAATRAVGTIGLQAQEQKLAAQTSMIGNLLSGGMSMLTAARGQTAGLLGNMVSAGVDLATPVMTKNDPVGDAISMGINAVGVIGGIVAAPATGGMSLLGSAAALGNMTKTGHTGSSASGGSSYWG